MNTTYIQEKFEQVRQAGAESRLEPLRRTGFNNFNRLGIPTAKHEEWKYTRIGSLFNKEYVLSADAQAAIPDATSLEPFRLPGHENANELVFINGVYSAALSAIRSSDLIVMPLEQAAADPTYADTISANLGHSYNYLKDGINALNTAFVQGGIFVQVNRSRAPKEPVYIYHVANAADTDVLAQPRSLVYLQENAQLQVVETFASMGKAGSFTNQVMEIVLEQDALLEYYKIQNDNAASNQVSTTHVRQTGKSYSHLVTITLNGGIVRNNLNLVLDAEYCEAHLYGLYFQQGQTHVDNHTVVDNRKPNCLSNELYKGIMADKSTAVFNGKIFVQPQAQKTNAYQSNKNILLSPDASVNTKPQLEIFADDVKCSHGCTIGQLNEESLFYLRSRGISEENARALLVHAFAIDILEHVKPAPLREYVNQLISKRLSFEVI